MVVEHLLWDVRHRPGIMQRGGGREGGRDVNRAHIFLPSDIRWVARTDFRAAANSTRGEWTSASLVEYEHVYIYPVVGGVLSLSMAGVI